MDCVEPDKPTREELDKCPLVRWIWDMEQFYVTIPFLKHPDQGIRDATLRVHKVIRSLYPQQKVWFDFE